MFSNLISKSMVIIPIVRYNSKYLFSGIFSVVVADHINYCFIEIDFLNVLIKR